MANDLACPSCDSPSVVYPEGSDDGPVVCGTCGTFLATLAQFRQFLNRQSAASEEQTTTGC
jgi:uncharacterized Zn finger protein (UPF0148 family)